MKLYIKRSVLILSTLQFQLYISSWKNTSLLRGLYTVICWWKVHTSLCIPHIGKSILTAWEDEVSTWGERAVDPLPVICGTYIFLYSKAIIKNRHKSIKLDKVTDFLPIPQTCLESKYIDRWQRKGKNGISNVGSFSWHCLSPPTLNGRVTANQ